VTERAGTEVERRLQLGGVRRLIDEPWFFSPWSHDREI
jgi:hypothetical protein